MDELDLERLNEQTKYTESEIQEAVALYRNNMNQAHGVNEVPTFDMLDTTSEDFIPNSQPFRQSLQAPTPTPGFVENFSNSFKKTSSLYTVASSVYEGIENENPENEDIPDDWTPYNIEQVNDLSAPYMSYVLGATSPNDQRKRRDWALKEMERDEYFANGSMFSSMLGGFAGGFASPEFFIPMAQFVKYQKLAPNVYKNMMRSMPSLGASTVLYNAQNQMTKKGGNFEDFLVNTGTEIMAGTFMIGGAAGLGRVATGAEMFAARRAMKMNYEGVGAVFKVNDKAEITGFAAKPAANLDVSAAKVSEAQEFLDSKVSRKALLKIPLITGAVSKVSPVFRMLNSPYGTVRKTINKFADFTIETEGDLRGQTRGVSFEQKMKEVNASAASYSMKYNGYKAEAKGVVNKSPELVEKSLMQQFDSEFNPKDFDFNREVALGITSGEQSSLKSANDIIFETTKTLDDWLNRYQRAKGFKEESWLPPNAKGYLTTRYNTDSIAYDLPRWKAHVSNEMMGNQVIIDNLLEPIESAQAEIKRLKDKIKKGQDLQRSKTTLKEIEEIYKDNKDELVRNLRDNAGLHNLLDDRNFLSSTEAAQLKKFLEPLETAQTQLGTTKTKIKNMTNKISRLNRKNEKTILKDEKANQKLKSEIDKQLKPLKKEREKLIDERKKLEDEVFTIKNQMTLKAHNGEINPNFYTVLSDKNGEVLFHDPNKLPKFMKRRTREEWEEIAENQRWVFEGSTPEQLSEQMLSQLSGFAPTNPTQKRVIMLEHAKLIAAGFADDDVPKIVATYIRTMGKRAAFEETTKGFGVSKSGIDGLLESLNKEKIEKDAKAQSITDEKKRKKAINKNRREYSRAEKDIKKVVDIALGRHVGTPEARAFVNAVRNLQVSTMLGGVPLTQPTDLSGVAFKHGMFALMRDFLAPQIQTLNGLVKSKQATAMREQSEEALLSLNHAQNGYADKFFNEMTQDKPALVGGMAKFLDKTAHFSGNFFGTNYFENWLQRGSANVLQSRIMRAMVSHTEGILSKKDAKMLRIYGLDPNKWADTFVQQFKQTDGFKGTFRNYQSNWHLWADVDASNAMARAVNRGVNDIVLKGGLYESPLISKNPYLNLLFSFTGWAFSAFNRYTIPLLQSPDVEKAQGVLLGIALGTLEDPLRKWTRGEDAEILDENWAIKAMGNSGTFALIHSGAMLANAATDRQFLSFMENDRRRGQTVVGMLGGPTVGLTERAFRGLKMFGSGKFNQRDAKQTWNTIPLMNAWYLRYLNNTLAETMFGGLPEKPQDATGWME